MIRESKVCLLSTSMYTSGIPAKTGVGGGVMGVLPGHFGIATFAPPLDGSGNSVKAQLAIE